MTAYLARRLAISVATLIVASIVVFAVLEVLPGDPARLMLGMNASEATVNVLREQLGLNLPVPLRYLDWAGGLLARRTASTRPAFRSPASAHLLSI